MGGALFGGALLGLLFGGGPMMGVPLQGGVPRGVMRGYLGGLL